MQEMETERCGKKSQTVMFVGVMSFFSLFFLSLLWNCNAMNVNVNVTIGNLRLQIALWARMTRINNSGKLYMIGQIFFCISSALKWLCRYNEDRLYQKIEPKRYKWTTKIAQKKHHQQQQQQHSEWRQEQQKQRQRVSIWRKTGPDLHGNK